MLPEANRMTTWTLVKAGLRRSRRRTMAGVVVALVAAAALLASLWMLRAADQSLTDDLKQLGADIVLVPKGYRDAVNQLLQTGSSPPIPATINPADYKKRLREAKVMGTRSVQGWNLEEGGAGTLSTTKASVVFVRLEPYVSPILTAMEVEEAIPEAEVISAEQATRQVTRHLQLLVRLLNIAAGISLLASVLMTGLLTSIRVAERRQELGMLRAVGASRSFLLKLVLAETGVPALAGALAGAVLAIAFIAVKLGLDEPLVLALYALGGLALVTTISVLSALVPAFRAAWMDPLDAVRQGR